MMILKNRKVLLLLTAVALVLAVSVGGTIAYLSVKTEAVVNTFEPVKVDVEIEEENEADVKKNVAIKNKNDSVAAFIRAMVVVSWQKGNDVIPAKEGDYTITFGNGWAEENGFYYWPNKVAPNAVTGVLIESAAPVDGKSPADGYNLHIEVLAQAVQAEGLGEGIDTAQEAFATVKGN